VKDVRTLLEADDEEFTRLVANIRKIMKAIQSPVAEDEAA
jgi:hypothetical protein